MWAGGTPGLPVEVRLELAFKQSRRGRIQNDSGDVM
jgi:hypothetical protein